jgi:hypothetical protein
MLSTVPTIPHIPLMMSILEPQVSRKAFGGHLAHLITCNSVGRFSYVCFYSFPIIFKKMLRICHKQSLPCCCNPTFEVLDNRAGQAQAEIYPVPEKQLEVPTPA